MLEQANADGIDIAHGLFALVEPAVPSAAIPLAARVLAVLTGRTDQVAKHLAAEVATLAALRRAQQLRVDTNPQVAERAGKRITALLADVEWPEVLQPVPDRSLISPQRQTADREGAGTWRSAKLGRDIGYESSGELRTIQLLDHAPQVTWFCEQPVAIGYSFEGRHRTYYPDLLMATADGRCVLIEVKSQIDMALAINHAKAAAARAFCARYGWGYLCTDGSRTLRSMQALHVPEPAARELIDLLQRRGTVRWWQTEPIRKRHEITGLHLAALVIQRGWDLHLDPYRITLAVEAGSEPRGADREET